MKLKTRRKQQQSCKRKQSFIRRSRNGRRRIRRISDKLNVTCHNDENEPITRYRSDGKVQHAKTNKT